MSLPTDILDVRPGCQEKKERAEKIFSLGQPCDRFDMQRMQTEDGGGDGSGPDVAGGPSQQQIKQGCIQRVEQQIFDVHGAGSHAEERHVQFIRQPGERMVVGQVAGLQGVFDVGPGEAGGDVVIVIEISVVVVIDELQFRSGAIDGRCDGCQSEADQEIAHELLLCPIRWPA